MTVVWPVILVGLAVAGTIVLRVILARVEPKGRMAEEYQPVQVVEEDVRYVLSRWGVRCPVEELPEICGQLHPELHAFFREYARVRYDDQSPAVYDRELLQHAYDANQSFVQIGDWGEGSPILTKRVPDDPRVYISDVEHDMPHEVRVLAGSIGEFLCRVKRNFETYASGDAKQHSPASRSNK